MDDRYFTIAEIAERLKVSEKTVTRWLQSERLKGYKAGRQWRVTESALETFLQASTNK